MFSNIASKPGRPRHRAGSGVIIRNNVAEITNGLRAGDVICTFDDTPFSVDLVECDGSQIVNGANEFPLIAARYPALVSGADLYVPDARGTFLRHRDNGRGLDQDRATRSAGFTGGPTGDVPTTYQPWGQSAHYHQYTQPTFVYFHDGGSWNQYTNNMQTLNTTSNLGAKIATGEFRPFNIGVVYYMYFGD